MRLWQELLGSTVDYGCLAMITSAHPNTFEQPKRLRASGVLLLEEDDELG
jgi:hypothetical protein